MGKSVPEVFKDPGYYRGPAWYSAGPDRFKLTENRYLVLNDGQSYEITKDGKHPVESFIEFCQRYLAANHNFPDAVALLKELGAEE